MRILWHGVAPWQPTGYGQQAGIWARKLRDAGHEVAISAQGGASTCGPTGWEGITVFPSANELEAVATVSRWHLQNYRPDLVICLYDGWQMGPGVVFDGFKTLSWLPVDTDIMRVGDKKPGGVAFGDRLWLRQSKAIPIAMSKHGQRMLQLAGYHAPLIPHGIDTTVAWQPLGDRRDAVRKDFGIPEGTFAVGINATNIDPHRKSISEQVIAFAKFHVKHPNSMLFLHSMVHTPNSLNLIELVQGCGIETEAVRLSDQGAMYTGSFPQRYLADWYGAMDVLMNASHGEGFGLASVEAQACGTPVILSKGNTGPELVGPGWLVGTQEFWNWTHQAFWHIPFIKDLVRALDAAYAQRNNQAKRAAARLFAEQFDIELVWPLWEKLIAEHQV